MIVLKPIHREKRPDPRFEIVTLRKGEFPAIRNRDMVLIDEVEFYVCAGMSKHEEDCEKTGAKRGDYKVRVKRV